LSISALQIRSDSLLRLNFSENMKTLILVLIMAADAIAFQQIFAVNAGGEAYTDADGIVYQAEFNTKEQIRKYFWSMTVHIGDVVVGRRIYQSFAYNIFRSKFGYNVSLENDGLYVLIAKFSWNGDTNFEYTITMTINDDIQLISGVQQRDVCGVEDFPT
jgi:hypothetical protein